MPRKLKSQDGNPYEIIRGMWEGAYVSHFLRLFQEKFGFNCLTTQDLEEALVDDESVALADVVARILRYLTGNTDILISNFESFLKKFLIKEKAEVPRFLESCTSWKELTPEEKLGTLKWLIDHVHQEKEEDIADYLDENYTPDDLRGICAGKDAFNNVYWYLDDLRLYREFSPKKQNKKDWECVCVTLSDWCSFIKQFRKTSNVQEKELYSYLNCELFPYVEFQLSKKGKKLKKSKEEKNRYLIDREQEDLEVMLEKKNFLDCNNSSLKNDVNGTGTLNHEKHNGSTASVDSTENDITDFLVKTEDNTRNSNMNLCDGHLSIGDTICSISNSLSSTMDIKTSSVSNMCSSSCATTCGNSQDACAVTNSVSAGNCISAVNCSTTPVSASTPILPSGEGLQDVNLQQPLSDIPSDSSSVASNKENAPPSSGNTGSDIPPMSAMSNMVGSTSTPATSASVQPLPSNVVNKTSFQLETQYMQQQSQIFVFSTALANKAAESYLSGNYPSIIAFHCAQPGTKSFLEKYPLKVQQFNRQNPAAWLNSLAQMKQSGGRQMKNMNHFPGPHNLNNRFPGPSGGPMGAPCTGACNMHGPGMCSAPRGNAPWPNSCGTPGMMPTIPNDMCPQSWSAQQFGPGISSSSMNHRFTGPVPQGLNIRQMGPSGNPLMGCMGNMNPMNVSGASFPNAGMNTLPMNQGPGGPSSLTGVKVPDENLTPQQRQHREEQLAMIRKMQQILFPEQQSMDQVQNAMGPHMGGMPPQQQPRFGSGDMCGHPGMDVCFNPHQPCMNDHDHSHPPDMYMDSQMGGPGFPQHNYPPASVSAQLEWQKLQSQFFEERRKKQVCGNSSLPNSSSGTSSQSQTPAQQQPAQSGQSQQSLSQPPTPQQQPANLNSPSPGMGLSPSNRMQGPPPPYHQTNRRTMPSPHPASPNTSSLSLPSPRMTSGLPSPAETSRQFPIPTPPGPRLPHPSPGSSTPAGSNSLHTTPLNSPKPLNTSGPGSNSGTLVRTPTTPSNTPSTPNGTPTSSCAPVLSNSAPATPAGSCTSSRKQSQSSVDVQDSNSVGVSASSSSEFSGPIPISTPSNIQGELFCHNMHSCSQSSQKQENCTNQTGMCQKEPSLMPVPSPQQIQYLNAFDGQELTIQKQPNTSIRELDMMSPTSMPPSMGMSGGSHSQFQSPDAPSFPNTPGSCPSALENSQDSLTGRYPSSAPASMEAGIQRFTAPSPQMPGFDPAPRHMVPAPHMGENAIQRFPMTQNMDMMRIPGPNSVSHNPLDENVNRFPGPTSQGPGFGPNPSTNVNMTRFPGSATEAMQRFRGPSPHTNLDMGHSRFMGSSPHVPCVDGISQSSQFNLGSETLTPIQSQSFPSSASSVTSRSSPCVGSTFIDNMSHSHLQNLQKMTPPFENMSTNKVSPDAMSPMGQCSNSSVNSSNNMSVPSYVGTSPLTSSSQVGPSQRLTHFDPIASMAAMSESTVPLATAGGAAQNHQNNLSNIHVSGNSSNSNQPNIANFHTNMQSIQNIMPSSVACTVTNQNPFSMHNQMSHNIACGPQTVNNTYANVTMQQLNMPAVVTTAPYNNGNQGSNMNPHAMHSNCQGSGANTISCSVTTNHPIMHTSVSTRTSNSNMVMPGPRHGLPGFPGQAPNHRNAPPANAGSPSMMTRGAPFNSPTIQMKPSAPNTIQYLPARQQNASPMSNRPPSLEFLQRFAAPLTNLDNKVPTHNLQYFPSNGSSNPPSVHSNVGMNPGAGPMAPGLMNSQRPPVNMMMGPMMRGTSSNVTHPSGQIYPVGSGLPGAESPMFGRPPCPSVNNQMIPVNAMSGSQGVGMFPNKQMPLPMGGMAPDATQPLPPSMGQSFSYKQSPFYGPTTADPNYAVQFHNFQQQLYATNTRSSQIGSQTNMSSQGFFGPK